jgi:plastocyanin
VIALALVIVAGCAAGSSSPSAAQSTDPKALTITARDLEFSTSTLSAAKDEPFKIVFDNQEAAPHNVAIYRDAAATDGVFVPDPFSGPATVTYDVPALAAGTYFFRCDLHPDMSGELTVG